jgi:allantoinase
VKEHQTHLNLNPAATTERAGCEMIIDLIRQRKMNVHLTDVSAAECLPLIAKYKSQKTAKQSTLSVETSYPYLSLTSEEIPNGKTEHKCLPPVRSASNRNKLWEAIDDFACVSSSHMPGSIKSKCLIGGRNRGNFVEASCGISSLQYGLSIFWTECQKRGFGIHDLHRFMSHAPAKLCGLDKNKGVLKVGFDADFCIWDPEEEWTISKDSDLLNNKVSPYYGRVVRGRVYATVVRGFFVYDGNHPNDFDDAIGTVLLKKPMKKCERRIQFDDGEEPQCIL